jgi:CheY-like chemotaxis protein
MLRPRIVVADDHDKTRAAITSLLAADFDVVSSVADGQAAVEAVRALYPDLVVLDISMPASTASRLAPSSGTCPTRPGSSLSPRTTTRQSSAPRPRWAPRLWCGSRRC